MRREPVSVYFTGTEKTARENAVGFIQRATKTLDIALYAFTEPTLMDALHEAREGRGLAIRLLLDEQFMDGENSTSKGFVELLVGIGVEVKVDRRGGLMHHKFAIADANKRGKYACLTGSYNWTKAASRVNRENLVIVRTRKAVDRFVQEFNAMWEHPKAVKIEWTPRGITSV